MGYKKKDSRLIVLFCNPSIDTPTKSLFVGGGGLSLVLHNFSRYNIAEKSDRRLSKMRAEEVFVSFFIIAEMTMTENS